MEKMKCLPGGELSGRHFVYNQYMDGRMNGSSCWHHIISFHVYIFSYSMQNYGKEGIGLWIGD